MDRFFVDKNNINLENNTCVIVGEDVKHISKDFYVGDVQADLKDS